MSLPLRRSQVPSNPDPPQKPLPFRVFRDPETGPATLCGFAESWFIPEHLLARSPAAKPATIAELRTAINHWRRLVGDPPLAETTVATCKTFLDLLRQLPGRSEGEKLSTNTVYKIATALQEVLNYAGPAGAECRKPAEQGGLFGPDQWGRPRSAPWFPECSRARTLPRSCLTPSQICDVIAASKRAPQPFLEAITAAEWWNRLYRFLLWTGLRIGSAIAAAPSWIHRDGSLTWIQVPPAYAKGSKPLFVWLHPKALAAIEGLAGQKFFPWPHSLKHLHVKHADNLKAAGLLPLMEFQFHNFRRRIGSSLYELNPSAPKILLCHAGGVTVESYIQVKSLVTGQRSVLKPVMDRLAKKLDKDYPGVF